MSDGRSWLDRIVAARRVSIAEERAANAHAPPAPSGGPRPPARTSTGVRDFEAALRAPGRRFIAEIKRRSPSAGVIRDPLDPAAIASQYARAGAAALSVLTEPEFFGGGNDDLVTARAACALPVLRKDFVLDREMVVETRAMGADAVLLIAAVLSPAELRDLVTAAHDEGLSALVEVHDERELDGALDCGARIVGVNSRDLRDFSVDLERSERLASRIPPDVVRVAESGIRTGRDVARLEAAGFRAFLVGESLLRTGDPGARLAELLS